MRARILGFVVALVGFMAIARIIVFAAHLADTRVILLNPCEPIAASYPGEGWACTEVKMGGLCCRWERGKCHDFPHAYNCAD